MYIRILYSRILVFSYSRISMFPYFHISRILCVYPIIQPNETSDDDRCALLSSVLTQCRPPNSISISPQSRISVFCLSPYFRFPYCHGGFAFNVSSAREKLIDLSAAADFQQHPSFAHEHAYTLHTPQYTNRISFAKSCLKEHTVTVPSARTWRYLW